MFLPHLHQEACLYWFQATETGFGHSVYHWFPTQDMSLSLKREGNEATAWELQKCRYAADNYIKARSHWEATSQGNKEGKKYRAFENSQAGDSAALLRSQFLPSHSHLFSYYFFTYSMLFWPPLCAVQYFARPQDEEKFPAIRKFVVW